MIKYGWDKQIVWAGKVYLFGISNLMIVSNWGKLKDDTNERLTMLQTHGYMMKKYS